MPPGAVKRSATKGKKGIPPLTAISTTTTASKKKKSTTAPKRQKSAPSPPCPIITPLVSCLTGRPYTYDAPTLDPMTVLLGTPSSVTSPRETGLFLHSAATSFTKEILDVLYGDNIFILIFRIHADHFQTYYKFVKTLIKIPNTDCIISFTTACMDEILADYVQPAILNKYLIATGIQIDSADMDTDPDADFLSTSTSSSDSEEETQPTSKCPVQATSIEEPPTSMAIDTIQDPLPESIPVPTPDNSPPASANNNNDVAPTDSAPQRGRQRSRFTPVDFSKLDVVVPPPPTLVTVIIRPTSEKESLKHCNPSKLTKALAQHGKWLNYRNIRNGGLAVDYEADTDPTSLLALTTIVDIPIHVSLPHVPTDCTGVLTGIHWELSEIEIQEELITFPNTTVTAVKRLAKPGQKSWIVKISFAGTTLPTHASLFGRRHQIKPYVSNPLLCHNCSRYGHIAKVCRSGQRCKICTQDHPSSTCPNSTSPKCCHCSGDHTADSKDCPTRAFQVKVCTVKATHGVTFKVARKAVGSAARSYAAALKQGSTTTTTPVPRPASRPIPTNVVHPAPLPPPATAADLASLFRGLIAILTSAASSGDFTSAIANVCTLFKHSDPTAHPTTYDI